MKQEKRKETSIKDDLLFLILKILIFVALLAVTFLFIFGICRISDNMMSPAFKDGDLAVYYRLQKEFQPSDTVVLEKDGEVQVRRILAVAGDEVNLTGRRTGNQRLSTARIGNLYRDAALYRGDHFSVDTW